jgi:glycosyltransferase involved in cell wall biosynthesis
MNYNHKITIFTPTYNRAYILDNLYRSLKRQSFRDFEWLVVDDGSVDNTFELVSRWISEENDFPIRYYKKENGGKCRAINLGLSLAEGELFFCVDSDDFITDDALENIIQWESELPRNEKYCGVSGNLGTSFSSTPNTMFTNRFYDGSLLDRYSCVDGERALIFYTDVHRRYYYPEIGNEKFMTEAVAWNRMAYDGYKIRFYNDIICIYEYKPDGLTKAGFNLFENNPYGYGLWLKELAEFLNYTIFQKFMMMYSFTCDLKKRYSDKIIAKCIGTNRVIIRICRLLGGIKKIRNCGDNNYDGIRQDKSKF